MDFWDLIAGATLLVQLIMALLLAASIVSWVIILQRRVVLRRAERDLGDFEQAFKQRDSLESLFVALTRNKQRSSAGMAWVFEAGMREFHRQAARGQTDPERLVEVGRREMRLAQMNEMERLESGLAWLATIGSVSPYVGLFGTVWGIMNSFRALGNVDSATLSLVAPGIAEALIATAMGPVRRDSGGYRLQPLRQSRGQSRSEVPGLPGRERDAASRARPFGPGREMKRRLVNEINVVPYIDVMLVLLVIFMITAPLLTQGIRVDLPRLAAEPLPQELIRDNRPLVVTVDAQGQMYLNIGEDPDEPLDSPVMVARTAAVLTRKPETPVLVRASEQLPYGDVVTVMGLLTRAGAGKVGLVTRPLPAEEAEE